MSKMTGLGDQLGLTVVGERHGQMVIVGTARLKLDQRFIRALKFRDYVGAGGNSMEVDIEGLGFDFEEWRVSHDQRLKRDDSWAVVAIGGHDVPLDSWGVRVFMDDGVAVARAEFGLGGESFFFESRPASFFVRSRDVYVSLLGMGFGVEEEYEDGMASVFLTP